MVETFTEGEAQPIAERQSFAGPPPFGRPLGVVGRHRLDREVVARSSNLASGQSRSLARTAWAVSDQLAAPTTPPATSARSTTSEPASPWTKASSAEASKTVNRVPPCGPSAQGRTVRPAEPVLSFGAARTGTGSRTSSARPGRHAVDAAGGASEPATIDDPSRSRSSIGEPTTARRTIARSCVGEQPLEAASGEEADVAAVEGATLVVVEASEGDPGPGVPVGEVRHTDEDRPVGRRGGRTMSASRAPGRSCARARRRRRSRRIRRRSPTGRPSLRSASTKPSRRSPTPSCLTTSTPITWCP